MQVEYKKIDIDDITVFKKIVSSSFVYTDADRLSDYSHDETEDLVFSPEIVLKPNNTYQVSLILKYCFDNNISVTPCGARTGLSGGSLPIYGGIALSLEKMNSIINIDERRTFGFFTSTLTPLSCRRDISSSVRMISA